MASRFGLIVILLTVASVLGASAAARPSSGTAIYIVKVDPRLCPSPLCGGYWVALANAARTRCADGTRNVRCYVARAVSKDRGPLEVSLADSALVRAELKASEFGDFGKLGELVVAAVHAPAGSAAVTGGYYRITDIGIRCVRAPCFSYRSTQVNGRTRIPLSGVDLAAAQASQREVARAEGAIQTKNGLLARGRFATSPDGGRVFRALRFYLRVPQPRA